LVPIVPKVSPEEILSEVLIGWNFWNSWNCWNDF